MKLQHIIYCTSRNTSTWTQSIPMTVWNTGLENFQINMSMKIMLWTCVILSMGTYRYSLKITSHLNSAETMYVLVYLYPIKDSADTRYQDWVIWWATDCKRLKPLASIRKCSYFGSARQITCVQKLQWSHL